MSDGTARDAGVIRHPLEDLTAGGHVLRVDAIQRAAADDLLRIVAQDVLDRRTLVLVHPAKIHDRRDIRGVLDEPPEVLLALLQRSFGILLVGDVTHDHEPSRQLAVMVGDRGDGHVHDTIAITDH